MQARFLLGPAGSGKTFRCLDEIRAELLRAPDGPPLILLAPKQATFQLERQLLGWGETPGEPPANAGGGSRGRSPHRLNGFARLHILSFERLARHVLEALRIAPPPALSEEGRVMVLRALLLQRAGELKRFHKSARRPGFAQQLSALLAEFQGHQLPPARLLALAERGKLSDELQAKLHDLALLAQAYGDWLKANQLQDAKHQLESATTALREKSEIQNRKSKIAIAALWLDGFAEMTPAELDLLAAVLPHCERATLAFCLDHEPQGNESWLSIWAVVGRTFQRCRERVLALPDAEVTMEFLSRDHAQSRFASNPVLAHLEAGWAAPGAKPPVAPPAPRPAQPMGQLELFGPPASPRAQPFPETVPTPQRTAAAWTDGLPRLVSCADPDAEATFAAREITKFVRAGGRFREAAVLVRSLDEYHKPLERAFRRYGVPYFLDRREGVAHHPLAELTRSALRTVAFDWQHEDWFAALKAGFSSVEETELDQLENEALARGWRGAKWRAPLQLSEVEAELGDHLERLRKDLLPPFTQLAARLAEAHYKPTGKELAESLREFWSAMKVEERLEEWTGETFEQLRSPSLSSIPNGGEGGRRPGEEAHGFMGRATAGRGAGNASIHATVRTQMESWLGNLSLAFARESLALRDWLPVLEAGLANLSVGVIPPALDQVLIGAIDRSRNPDLKLAVVLGLNEGVFPAAPAVSLILSETDRDELEGRGVALGPNLRDRLANERYYGYIACTRSSERLVLAWSEQDADGRKLNASPFVSHLRRLFPEIQPESFAGADWPDAEHVNELIAPLAGLGNAEVGRVTPCAPPDQPQPHDGAQGVTRPTFNRLASLLEIPAVGELSASLSALRNADPNESLSPALAEMIYGKTLKTSVSRLEQFAACPFRFFVHSGLRAEERKVFELDFREQGSFQHDVLQAFHEQLGREGKRWRDITTTEARDRIGRIAGELMANYREGLLRDSAQTEFTARVLTRALQDFIEVLVGWMHTRYRFDPAAVELEFSDEGNVPAWKLDLGGGRQLVLRGRIDRVDLHREPGADAALCVVIDYKSSQKRLDPLLLENGVQLQLLSYLNVLQQWPAPAAVLGVSRIVPAGVFYVNLRARPVAAASRAALGEAMAARQEAYRHTGRFRADVRRALDASNDAVGEQFKLRLKQDGTLDARSTEALSPEEFGGLLAQVESLLRDMGERIFAGEAKVDPYRKGTSTPCEFCDYAPVCRIDPWTQEYRLLHRARADAPDGEGE